MDIIVLGLLMIRSCTIYEMRKSIETWLSNISSNSLGSIQASIKKLMDKDMIDFSEYVENSVNKKAYAITEKGKKYFLENISSPMLYKEKNMELSKFFFMGFSDQHSWEGLIDAYIVELQRELNELEKISTEALPRFDPNENFVDTLREKGVSYEITDEQVNNIALFQYATLDLGMEQLKFQIKWFEKFKQTLLNRGE